jgi:hypothetical protein
MRLLPVHLLLQLLLLQVQQLQQQQLHLLAALKHQQQRRSCLL